MRPVVILTRQAALEVLTSVTVAPITSHVRSIRSQVLVGPEDGLAVLSAVSLDNIQTLGKGRPSCWSWLVIPAERTRALGRGGLQGCRHPPRWPVNGVRRRCFVESRHASFTGLRLRHWICGAVHGGGLGGRGECGGRGRKPERYGAAFAHIGDWRDAGELVR